MHFVGGYPSGLPVRPMAEEPPLVRVMGEGQVEVPPDSVEISLGFSVRAGEAATAYRQTAAAMNQVVRALTEAGIPRDQMQTEQISLRPVYEQEQLVGYEGSAILRVTLRDPSIAGETIDRAVAAGANLVLSVSFQVREPGPHEAAALTRAVQDAQRKAAVLARALGIGLGPVWRTEAEPAPGPILALARPAPLEAMPVLPGTLTVTRRVRVEFTIPYP